MPSTSSKQHKFMEAVAHSPSFAKKAGVPQSVGQEFSKADKGRKFSKGGDMASKMNPGFMAMMAKKKDGMHKMPDGKMMKDSAMKKGGMAKGDMPAALAKHAAKPASKAHKGLKDGGMTGYAKGGGIEAKGKTKGTMVAMKKGGKC